MDAASLSTLLVAAGVLLTALSARTSTRGKADREELRRRRKLDVLRIRYAASFEEEWARLKPSRPPITKPKGLAELEEEEW